MLDDAIGRHDRRTGAGDDSINLVGIEIRNSQYRAVGVKKVGEALANVSDTLDRHSYALESVASERMLHRGADPNVTAVGGPGKRITAMRNALRILLVGDSRYVGGRLCHQAHVRDRGARILGCNVPAAHPIDARAHCAEQCRCLVAPRVPDQDGFAATEREACQCRLIGHAPREPEHVAQGLLATRVRMHANAAERRAERGVVDRDDCAQPRLAHFEERYFLVTVELLVLEYTHLGLSALMVRNVIAVSSVTIFMQQ